MNTTPEGSQKDLRELRVRMGKTQADLGAKTLISLYENGHRMPGPRSISDMAARLGVEPEVVYDACEESKRRAEARASAPAPASEQATDQEERVAHDAAQPTAPSDATVHG